MPNKHLLFSYLISLLNIPGLVAYGFLTIGDKYLSDSSVGLNNPEILGYALAFYSVFVMIPLLLASILGLVIVSYDEKKANRFKLNERIPRILFIVIELTLLGIIVFWHFRVIWSI